jgi:hypothetical protein
MLRTDRDTKQTSPEHDLFCSALTVLIQLMRLLLYGDEAEMLRRNYKTTWQSNFEFPQKYITRQTAIYLKPRARSFTGQREKKSRLTFGRPTRKHVYFSEILNRIKFVMAITFCQKVRFQPSCIVMREVSL